MASTQNYFGAYESSVTPGYAGTEVEVKILQSQVRFLYSQWNNLRFVVSGFFMSVVSRDRE